MENNEIRKLNKNLRYLQLKRRMLLKDKMCYGHLFESAVNKLRSGDVSTMEYFRLKEQAKSARAKLQEIDSVLEILDSTISSIERRFAELSVAPTPRRRAADFVM